MAAKQAMLRDGLTYFAFRVVVMFVHMLGPAKAYAVGGRLGELFWRLYGRGRKRAIEHIHASFPDWSDARCREVAAASMRHMMYLAIDVLLITRFVTMDTWSRRVQLCRAGQGVRRILAARAGGVIIAGHHGCWEAFSYVLTLLGFRGYAIARPLDNPYLDGYIRSVRERQGLNVLDKFGAMARVNRLLGEGELVGFVADQDAGRRGVFVDYLGRQASTYRGPARMAVEHDVPVFVVFGHRTAEQFHFELGVERIIEPAEWKDKDDPVRWLTQEWTAALERIVRRDPEQYWWTYRRWKTQPPATSE